MGLVRILIGLLVAFFGFGVLLGGLALASLVPTARGFGGLFVFGVLGLALMVAGASAAKTTTGAI